MAKFSAKREQRLRSKCEQLWTRNKQLANECRELSQKLMVKERYCYALNAALEQSQQLVQHLKAERRLLRSAHELNSTVGHLNDCVITHNMTADNALIATADAGVDPDAGRESPLFKCDQIADEFEQNYWAWKLECDLLSMAPIVCVTVDDGEQMLANKQLSADEDDGDDGDSCGAETELTDACDNSGTKNIKTKEEIKEIKSLTAEVETVSNANEKSSKSSFKCEYCGCRHDNEALLNDHKTRHLMAGSDKIKCAFDKCQYVCDSRHDLHQHIKIHRSEKHVDMKSSSTSNGTHVKPNTQSEKTLFKCSNCQKALTSRQSLRKHLKNVHDMISWFRCKYCELKFEKGTDLRTHEEFHRNQGHTYTRVPNSNTTNVKLNSILAKDTKKLSPQNMSLSTIDLDPDSETYSAFTQNDLSLQTLLTSPYFPQTSTPANAVANHNSHNTDNNESDEKVKCDKCDRFYRKDYIKRHIKTVHSINANSDVSNPKKMKIENSKPKVSSIRDDDSDSGAPIDMNKRLQLLNLFYAEQKKQTELH